MIREALKILAALLENCASAINERLDPPLPMVSREAAEEMFWIARHFASEETMHVGFADDGAPHLILIVDNETRH